MAKREYTSMTSHQLSEDIIERISNHPEMWSCTHPMYRNRAKHKIFWDKTSKELGVSVNFLKKRWKHLKDQYRKEVKRALEKGDEDCISWKNYESLHFLREEVLRDKTVDCTGWVRPAPAQESEGSEGSEEEREGVAGKVRVVEAKADRIYSGLMETKAAVEERMKALEDMPRHDPDYMYLMSLLPSLKQLSEIQKLKLKGKINEWLIEAYMEHSDYIVPDGELLTVTKQE